MRDGHVMKWMKDPLAGFISRCGARMGKFTALLVTIAMLAGTTGAGATAFADETVTDGGNVAAESAASQPESTQQSDAENAVGSDVADIAGQDVAGQSATDDDELQFELTPSVSLYDAKIIVSVTSFNAFAKEVVALADGFDPDYETSLWIGPDGHGANGAPYHIRDILDDMDAVQSAYNELADAFRPFVTEF